MNIFILTILFISFLNNVSSITSNCGARIKNSYLKLILFSDKRNIKIFKEIKNFYKICYEKSISSIGEGISDYNNKLTENEKTIIETIISLCY
jgi:hypothetical protein